MPKFNLSPRTFFLLLSILTAVHALAIPASRRPADVRLPDGSMLTVLLHGDEFMHFNTTTDGYTIVRADNGFYYYADRQDGMLLPSAVRATDPARRTPAEQAYVKGLKKMMQPRMTENQLRLKASASRLYADDLSANQSSTRAPHRISGKKINYDKFKGLILLIEFSDRQFQREDANQFYTTLSSEKNLKGYYDSTGTKFTQCDGSVRDYFFDNSMGIFDPTFDVIGPVKINYKATDVKAINNIETIIRASLKAADDVVDFKQYDLDENGYVDMVYFIYAGYGSHIGGNNKDYLWPHASDLAYTSDYFGLKHDGMKFSRYACSVEIFDSDDDSDRVKRLDGIGTMCHEFSHVLGLADHYDTNYEEDGLVAHPASWDIMANGSDFNYGLTPVGYNCYERYSLGFAPVKHLDVAGQYELQPFNTSNEFLRLETGTKGEVFFIENRQQQGWDRYLPGHGLLVWRADSTNINVWRDNEVNKKSSHPYFELLRAMPEKISLDDSYVNATSYDSYPGSGHVIDLTATTRPALLSWKGQEAALDLYDITEDGDVIRFTAGKNLYTGATEDFEGMTATTADASDLQGAFCTWTLSKATISNTDDDGVGNGQRACKIARSGTVTSSPIDKPIRYFRFKVWTGNAQVRISLRANDGSGWKNVKSADGQQQTQMAKNSEGATVTFLEEIPVGTQLQIQMIGTSSTAVAYIDDIVVSFANSNEVGIATIDSDARLAARQYNLSGQRVADTYRGITVSNGRKQIRVAR